MAFKNSCRLPLLAALCLPLFLPLLLSQGSSFLTVAPPDKVVGKRNSTVEARLKISIQPGYHVNSNKPSDEYLIPLRLTWTPGGLEPGEIQFPKPQMEKYEFSNKPLSVYTGDFELVSKLKVPANAPAGPGAMLGKLRYQACNNKACFPPKNVEIRLPYQIQ